jgi:predicted DNA-binding transcriptional regulator YafY
MAPGKTKRSRSRSKGPSVGNLKLQRWIDLLAALLSHHYGATAAELREEVPAYASAKDSRALERMFERDKDELRAFGIPIEARPGRDGEPERYVVDPREMYLPYLGLAAGKAGLPRPGTKPGYRSLPVLTFESEELSALVDAAHVAEKLGDPVLEADVASAMRKLTFDLPVGSTAAADSPAATTPYHDAHGASLRAIGESLLRRKRVSLSYNAMTSDATSTRTVEPYGLFFLSGHWYLAARDADKGDVRNFRVSRMSRVAPNQKRLQTPDYSIPSSFRLADHARARAPWEIGNDDEQQMVVEFRGESGATRAAAALGRPVDGAPRHRRFAVRRVDSFVRWILSFAGEAVPVSPPHLVDTYRDIVRATLSVYGSPAA